jgi:DEP domain-containing protein 5
MGLLTGCDVSPAVRVCSLTVHQTSHSSEELILNPDLFADFQVGELIQIYDPEKPQKNRLVFRVPVFPSTPPSSRLEVSILKTIADSVNLKQFHRVVVDRIDELDATLDFVELSFRKQYLQRGNMLRFKGNLQGRTVHFNQNLNINSMQAQVQELRRDAKPTNSGVIRESTKFVFRSKSSRIIWLVQISAEMWDVDEVTISHSYSLFHSFSLLTHAHTITESQMN